MLVYCLYYSQFYGSICYLYACFNIQVIMKTDSTHSPDLQIPAALKDTLFKSLKTFSGKGKSRKGRGEGGRNQKGSQGSKGGAVETSDRTQFNRSPRDEEPPAQPSVDSVQQPDVLKTTKKEETKDRGDANFDFFWVVSDVSELIHKKNGRTINLVSVCSFLAD